MSDPEAAAEGRVARRGILFSGLLLLFRRRLGAQPDPAAAAEGRVARLGLLFSVPFATD